MNVRAATGEDAVHAPALPRAQSNWRVRTATGEDAPAVAAAVGELLAELGTTPPSASAMEAAARVLIHDRHAGALLVAQAGAASDGVAPGSAGSIVGVVPGGAGSTSGVAPGGAGSIVGVLGVSWQSAIHIPGRYGLIQDLWVDPSWRGGGVGAGLLVALFELAREREVARLEVGLPRERFAGLAATEAFYVANGFSALGARMRRSLT
jgi:GNAT superfamily N-acetyltransferase